MYEEMVATYGRAEYANKAIDEYRAAIQADPSSDLLERRASPIFTGARAEFATPWSKPRTS